MSLALASFGGYAAREGIRLGSDDFAEVNTPVSGVDDTVHQPSDSSQRPISGMEETMARSGPRPSGQAHRDELTPGTMIASKYRIERALGVGGFGAVYEAMHVDIQRPVALKVLLTRAGVDPELVKRFQREARVATRIRHPNIVDVIDFGVDDGRPYLVMELLAGRSLGDTIEERGRLAVREIVPIVDGVLRALSTAHRAGIVHRDIKPDNVFLAEHESDPSIGMTVKVLDFGIAKWEQGDQTRLTKSQMSMGTAAYMAPEQVQSSRDVTQAADQYSAGVMLYEGLTGRLPHLASNYNEMIVAKVVSDPEPLAHLRPDLPPELCDVVMRSLAKEAEARFESVDALREALKPFHDFEEDGEGEVIRISHTVSAPIPASAKRAIAEAAVSHDTLEEDSPRGFEEESTETTTRADEKGRPKWILPAMAAVALTLVVGAAIGLAISGQPRMESSNAPEETPGASPVTRPVTPVPSEPVGETPAREPTLTSVRFTTSPDGASVSIDGSLKCHETPCTVELEDSPVHAVIERRGFQTATRDLEPPFDEHVTVELTRIRDRPTMAGSTTDMTNATPTMGGLPFNMM